MFYWGFGGASSRVASCWSALGWLVSIGLRALCRAEAEASAVPRPEGHHFRAEFLSGYELGSFARSAQGGSKAWAFDEKDVDEKVMWKIWSIHLVVRSPYLFTARDPLSHEGLLWDLRLLAPGHRPPLVALVHGLRGLSAAGQPRRRSVPRAGYDVAEDLQDLHVLVI